MDLLDALDRTFQHTSGVLAAVPTAKLDATTPCEEWRVRDLLEHMIGVVGPVLGEVFVVCADVDGIHLAGPCGPDAWHIEVAADDDPTEVVAATCRRVIGDPVVVHSTSWRTDKGGVMLTFVAVYEPTMLASFDRAPVRRAELARGDADAAPTAIAAAQVLEHALRHLAWLVADDDAVRAALDHRWQQSLASYVPEPFRALR